MSSRRLALLASIVLLPGALLAPPALAALGAGAASLAADASALGGTLTAIPLQRYDVDEIAVAGGLTVREFSSLDGTVFAVSWSGPVVPDLARLLGGRYAEYARAVATLERPGLQRSLRIALPDLVVELDGQLRGYTGRAYLPASIPAGVSTAELH